MTRFLTSALAIAFATAAHPQSASQQLPIPVPLTQGGTGAISAGAARSTLGVTATGADPTYATRANNLSDVANSATALGNLGGAPLSNPTFTGTVSAPALTLSGITGSTQCLHVNTSGQVSGAGGDCGSGSGGGGSMIYPGVGVPLSTGTAWGTSYGVNGTGSLLAAAGSIVIPTGKTGTINNTVTFAGTDGTTITLPSTNATLARTDANQSFAGSQVFAGGINLSNTGSLQLNGTTAFANYTPSCSVTGGSSTCTRTANAGSLAYEFTLGSAGSATSMTITPGFTAVHGFVCDGYDMTTPSERLIMTANSSTTSTLSFFNPTGAVTPPGASDVIWGRCFGL